MLIWFCQLCRWAVNTSMFEEVRKKVLTSVKRAVAQPCRVGLCQGMRTWRKQVQEAPWYRYREDTHLVFVSKHHLQVMKLATIHQHWSRNNHSTDLFYYGKAGLCVPTSSASCFIWLNVEIRCEGDWVRLCIGCHSAQCAGDGSLLNKPLW